MPVLKTSILVLFVGVSSLACGARPEAPFTSSSSDKKATDGSDSSGGDDDDPMAAPSTGSAPKKSGGASASWSGVYSQYFGPGSKGQCGNGSGCHGNASASNGFDCSSSSACYMSSVATGISTTPAAILVWYNMGGTMPLGGQTDSTAASAITAWVNAGAPSN